MPRMERGRLRSTNLKRFENNLEVLMSSLDLRSVAFHARNKAKAVCVLEEGRPLSKPLLLIPMKLKKLRKRTGTTKAQIIQSHTSEGRIIPREETSQRRATGEDQTEAMIMIAHSSRISAQVVQREAPPHSLCHQKMMNNAPKYFQQ